MKKNLKLSDFMIWDWTNLKCVSIAIPRVIKQDKLDVPIYQNTIKLQKVSNVNSKNLPSSVYL